MSWKNWSYKIGKAIIKTILSVVFAILTSVLIAVGPGALFFGRSTLSGEGDLGIFLILTPIFFLLFYFLIGKLINNISRKIKSKRTE